MSTCQKEGCKREVVAVVKRSGKRLEVCRTHIRWAYLETLKRPDQGQGTREEGK